MPADALPQPWVVPLEGSVRLRREYRDVLGRPLRGTATITGTVEREAGGRVVIPASVEAELVDGVLEVYLPPDTYLVTADLRTANGARASYSTTVDLTDS
jgi:hypothetical protein